MVLFSTITTRLSLLASHPGDGTISTVHRKLPKASCRKIPITSEVNTFIFHTHSAKKKRDRYRRAKSGNWSCLMRLERWLVPGRGCNTFPPVFRGRRGPLHCPRARCHAANDLRTQDSHISYKHLVQFGIRRRVWKGMNDWKTPDKVWGKILKQEWNWRY